MKQKRPSAKPRDLRWTLVDSVLRRLVFVVAHFGISPRELLDRAELLLSESRAGKVTKGPRDLRTYHEAHAAAEVMRIWHRYLQFLDPAGKPRRLSKQGPGSFEELVALAAPGVRPDVTLADLLTAGAVEEDEDGALVAKSFRVTQSGQLRRAEIALYAVENLLTSVGQNVRMEPSLRTLQTEAVCYHFDRKQLPRLKRQLTERCAAYMEETDDWLNHHEVPATSRRSDAATVAVGMYITVRESEKDAAKKRPK